MKPFGYLLVFLGIVVAIALFVTNGNMPEGQVISRYWYVLVLCVVMVLGGGVMTMLER